LCQSAQRGDCIVHEKILAQGFACAACRDTGSLAKKGAADISRHDAGPLQITRPVDIDQTRHAKRGNVVQPGIQTRGLILLRFRKFVHAAILKSRCVTVIVRRGGERPILLVGGRHHHYRDFRAPTGFQHIPGSCDIGFEHGAGAIGDSSMEK